MAQDESPFGSLPSSSGLGGDPGGAFGSDPGSGGSPRRTFTQARVIVFFVMVTLGAAGFALFPNHGGSRKRSATSPPAATATPERPSTSTPPNPTRPLPPREQPSPLSPSGMRRALRAVGAQAGSRKALTLRVDRSGLTVIVRGKVIVFRDGDVSTFPGPDTGTGSFALSSIDPAAPSRIERALARKGKRLDYAAFVVNPVTGKRSWVAQTVGGSSGGYGADASGRGLCPLGKSC